MCGSRKRSPGTDCPSASLGSMAEPATVERRDGRIGTALLERCLHRINIPDGPPGDPFGNELCCTRPRTLINQRCMMIDERLMLAIRPEPKRAPHKCGTWAQVINPPRTGHDRSGRASANHWGPWVVGLVSPTMADVREILASMTLGRRRAQSTQWPRCSSSGRRGGARRRFH